MKTSQSCLAKLRSAVRYVSILPEASTLAFVGFVVAATVMVRR